MIEPLGEIVKVAHFSSSSNCHLFLGYWKESEKMEIEPGKWVANAVQGLTETLCWKETDTVPEEWKSKLVARLT